MLQRMPERCDGKLYLWHTGYLILKITVTFVDEMRCLVVHDPMPWIECVQYWDCVVCAKCTCGVSVVDYPGVITSIRPQLCEFMLLSVFIGVHLFFLTPCLNVTSKLQLQIKSAYSFPLSFYSRTQKRIYRPKKLL